jgi:hypothetical protein
MAISTAALERAGIHVEPEEFDRLVADALAEIVPLRTAPAPDSELSQAEADMLAEGGFLLEALVPNVRHPLAQSAAAYAALLASSLTVGQAARRLGVNESRVRQRLAARTLYGIKERSTWRLPLVQFEADGLVRGMERVLPRLAASLHPLAMVGWFTTPNPDLPVGDEEQPSSPLEWLRSGRPIEVVADLAGDMGLIA